MQSSLPALRQGHRADVESLLRRAVEEEERRSGGRTDTAALLRRAREELDTLAAPAAGEYAAYLRALDEEAAAARPVGAGLSGAALGTPVLAAVVAAAAALGVDLGAGTSGGTAVAAGAAAVAAGSLAAVLRLTAGSMSAGRRRAGLRGRPGGSEQLRLEWLTAVEVRGVRPFLDRQRMLQGATRVKKSTGAGPNGEGTSRGVQLRGGDRSAAARQRSVLARSFEELPDERGPFPGRRVELARIAQWVQQARASTETRPVVVVLHGPPGVGRSALALRAAHALRDQFRAACLVDLRGESRGEPPLSTRDALLHLLNRLGAPRDQLLFRERSSRDQHLKRLSEVYHQHLTGLPVVIVLDDASDAEQVRALVPDRSESLVLVTSRAPLTLPADLAGWVHQLEVGPLDPAGAEELLRAVAEEPDPGPYDEQSVAAVTELCGGLPLALRVAGSSLGARSARGLAGELRAAGQPDPVQRALWLRYIDQGEEARRLLRRLALAGRASLGGAAAAALLGTGEKEAARQLTALARAGLLEPVHAGRYRMHDLVRDFAGARLQDEEEAGERGAAHERLIRSYAELADTVIRMVDGKTSTRADMFARGAGGAHGFPSLDAALRWLDDESSFITAALRNAEGVDQSAVLHLLGALCDYCLLRGDLYRLGELSELTQDTDKGLLMRSVQWRTGVAARQLGELDKSRTTLSSVVDLYFSAQNTPGAARALRDLGITLHHQGQLPEAAQKLREALELQSAPELGGDRAWTMHALAAVERDRGRLAEALELLTVALELHLESESVHGHAWAHFQLGQVRLRMGQAGPAEEELNEALELYGRTQDARGAAWALTMLARVRLLTGEASAAADGLRTAAARHREQEDARGEAWSLYYLGQALEDQGDLAAALRELERARNMFSRMRDVYGLACARHHSARVTRDQRAAQTGSLRNSGFARQLLQDARLDFQRVGVAHGEGWSCVELAVIDAGNGKADQALELLATASGLFAEVSDRRGESWARFLRCTLLPFASPGGSVVGAAVAGEELAALRRELAAADWAADPALEQCAEAYSLILERGADPEEGWQAWRLGMVPGRRARDVLAALPR